METEYICVIVEKRDITSILGKENDHRPLWPAKKIGEIYTTDTTRLNVSPDPKGIHLKLIRYSNDERSGIPATVLAEAMLTEESSFQRLEHQFPLGRITVNVALVNTSE